MGIVLGGYVFDEGRVSVSERLEEVGGRDGRVIVMKGLTARMASAAAVEAALDAILAASSAREALSLREGRRMWVTRTDFTRAVAREQRVGSFTLTLRADTPWEEAATASTAAWAIHASATTQALATAGNTWTSPSVALTAVGNLVCPGLSDGERSIVYAGTVPAGSVIVFDGTVGSITVDGVDVTAHGEGAFPRIAPTGTTVTYTDDGTGSHEATAEAAWRDRWW